MKNLSLLKMNLPYGIIFNIYKVQMNVPYPRKYYDLCPVWPFENEAI